VATADRPLIGSVLAFADHHLNARYRWMAVQRVDSVSEHGLTVDIAILLGDAEAGPIALPRRHYQGRYAMLHCHGWALYRREALPTSSFPARGLPLF